MDISSILELIISQGAWCAIFVYFFISSNKRNNEREDKYIETIQGFKDSINEVNTTLKHIISGGKNDSD